jgi:hypothetical protein
MPGQCDGEDAELAGKESFAAAGVAVPGAPVWRAAVDEELSQAEPAGGARHEVLILWVVHRPLLKQPAARVAWAAVEWRRPARQKERG